MNIVELIKQCKYYKGEAENPYIGKCDDNEDFFWYCESLWVSWSLASASNPNSKEALQLKTEVEHYENAQMHDFDASDGTPLAVKAILFNRYRKYCPDSSREDFVQWYREFYRYQ